jgi:benzylsuccinate CoA-transferase BbsF subunit
LVDVSQAEAGLQFLLPAYFDYAANGTVPQRQGADVDPLRAPSGTFRCAGDDRWIAIDASAPAHWQALRDLLAPRLDDPGFATLVGRLRRRADLHALVQAWTVETDADDAEQLLQSRGIPAHTLSDHRALTTDADLAADGYYGSITDPRIGTVSMRHAQCRIQPAATAPARAAPCMGDATDQILREALGFDDARIAQLREAGVLT